VLATGVATSLFFLNMKLDLEKKTLLTLGADRLMPEKNTASTIQRKVRPIQIFWDHRYYGNCDKK
jgi:hypothetical protein